MVVDGAGFLGLSPKSSGVLIILDAPIIAIIGLVIGVGLLVVVAAVVLLPNPINPVIFLLKDSTIDGIGNTISIKLGCFTGLLVERLGERVSVGSFGLLLTFCKPIACFAT